MANKIVGWMGLKNMLFTRRIEKDVVPQDLELVSNFLLAINSFSKELINCDLESITYFNNYEKDEGISFRIGKYDNDLVSVVIDEVDTRYEDFIFFEDQRSIKLMNKFYKENKEEIDSGINDVRELNNKVYEGIFNTCFNLMRQRGVKGYKKYRSTLLMMYGIDHESGNPEPFLQEESGYDVREYNFLKDKKHSKKLVMNLIESISNLQSELSEEESKKSISFLGMKNPKNDRYAIIEYKQPSPQIPEEKDTLGMLLRIEYDNEYGYPLTQKINKSFKILPEILDSYT